MIDTRGKLQKAQDAAREANIDVAQALVEQVTDPEARAALRALLNLIKDTKR